MTDRLTDEQLAAMQVADGFSAGDASPVAEMLVGNTLIGELFRREDAERIVSMLAECLRLREELKRSQKRIAQLQNDYKMVYSELIRLFDERAALLKQITAAVRIYDAFQCSVVTVPLRIQRAIDAFGDLLREDADR